MEQKTNFNVGINNGSCALYVVCLFPVSSCDKYYSLIAAGDLTVCRGSHDDFYSLAGNKSLW